MEIWTIIQQFIYILPLAGIVYKLGGMVKEHDQLKEKLDKLESDYGIHISNETIRYQELMKQMSDIGKAIERIETKLEERTAKQPSDSNRK